MVPTGFLCIADRHAVFSDGEVLVILWIHFEKNKYLLGMVKDILYVFDIMNAAIYNRVGRERKDGRSKRYVREHLSKPVGRRL